ncbi:myb-related transcription factor, partner of profilin-like [Saccostrea cucullata]|uniref:myb-related transcription factor, partner of profilin-like n=1 Tax=Saccostrea cuccullata TaxID=36930 RepID=UPI002ED68997
MESKDIKRRRPNWSEGELVALAEAVVPRAHYLKGKLSPSLTAERKQGLWEEVADEVNSVAMVKRTVDEKKKKWADMQSLTKKKEGERRRSMKMTGGGPGPNLIFKCWENLVLKSLSDVAIEGISSGVDTAECVQEASSISITAVVPSTTDSAKPGLPNQGNTMPQSLSSTSSRNGVKDTSTLSHGAVIPLTGADKPGTSTEGNPPPILF